MIELARGLLLYSTVGCHLCEQAQRLVWERLGCVAPELDVVDDEDLYARYGVRIPVLKRLDTGAELGWPFDAAALARFLDGGNAESR